MNDELNKFLNQSINALKDTEEKEYIFNSNYAGRKVNIKIKINALNQSTETGNTVQSKE
jgi:hypothetical protein